MSDGGLDGFTRGTRTEEGTSALNLVPDPRILEGAPYSTGKGSARRAPGRGLTCSVPTKLWPRRRASSWASMTTLMAFSVKRCWRGGDGGRVQKVRVVRLAVPRWFFFPSRGLDRGRFRVASTRATRSDARIHARDECTHTQGTMTSSQFRVRTVEWTIGAGLTGAHLEHGLGDETTATAGATSQP